MARVLAAPGVERGHLKRFAGSSVARCYQATKVAVDGASVIAHYALQLLIKVSNHTNTNMPPKTAEKTTEKPAAADVKAAEAAKASATRQRDLDAAISSITKAYGDGSIMRLGDARALRQIEVIPTGSLAMDLALGVGGIPRGRVVEIFGPESSGKTTLMLHVIANAQKAGGLAAFIDAEHALDPGLRQEAGREPG